ncbi:MAG: pseudaminic acid synthase [Desulfuromonadaceae bacterium]|nr:pseudaminic acid synthase [Desulfuromonadaceae bacterium]
MNPTPCIQINKHRIGPGHPCYIIAELSANHRQDYQQAVELVHAAKAAGADAVKLQTYTPDTITLDCDAPAFNHAADSLWRGKNLYQLYQDAYTPWEWQPKLKALANHLGLDLFSSPFDPTAVDFLEKMEVPAYKIASFEIVDIPLIEKAAATGKPLILSTGMATAEEIGEAVMAARNAGGKDIALLKCCSAYPARPEEMNLNTLVDIQSRFRVPIGLSDHTLTTEIAVAAVALGACIIEKHFTLDRATPSADAAFSLEPAEFRAMVQAVRTVEQALGTVAYGPTARERESLGFRRSLFVVDDIAPGECLTSANIRSVRPASGLAPKELKNILGRRARHVLRRGTPLQWEDIE